MDSYEVVSIRHAGGDGGGRGQALEGSSLATTAKAGPQCVSQVICIALHAAQRVVAAAERGRY